MTQKRHLTNQQGFTLVELSIVLVIIGLIIGGVLVGQNMIRAAEIRATISQIEKYNSAVNTFRGKYGGIPGDFSQAVRFGIGTTDGDGNGQIDSATAGVPSTSIILEKTEFWNQLSNSNMIQDTITLYTTGAVTMGTHFPASQHGIGGIVAYTDGQFNHFHIGISNGTGAPAVLTDIDANTLLPADAYTMDLKVDDGVASSGTVVAMEADFAVESSDDANDCVDATLDYDVVEPTRACQLRMRMM